MAILILILLNGFFVLGEFGLVAVERTRVERLARRGQRRARSAQRGLKTLSFQLSGAQLGITITSLLVGFIVEPTLGSALEPLLEAVGFIPKESTLGISVALALVLATAAQMVIGELVPKNYAIAKPLETVLLAAPPLRLYNALFRPLIVFLNSSANATVRLFGIEPQEELTSVRSLEELQLVIHSSREVGTLPEEEFTILSRSIRLQDKVAADALRPRTSVVALPEKATVKDLTDAAVESGYSRVPVYGRDLDDIIGIAHVKDAYRVALEERGTTPVTSVMQDALVVPESRDLASLLVELRRDVRHMAIVLDEYGGTSGVITVEDLIEEIVGEIEDEYDRALERAPAEPPAGVHVLSGMLHADEVKEQTGFEIPEGDYDTLAGFLLTLFDRIPAQGDHTGYEGWEFKVTRMDRNRIDEVLMVSPEEEP